MTDERYHPQKLKPLVRIIARAIEKNPALLRDIDDPDKPLAYLHAQLRELIPGFNDEKTCLNCGASMAQYTETLDVNDALLLINTAKHVRAALGAGQNFTEANKVRISSADGISHTQKCRTTKCSKLGLIAKAGGSQWAITTRGFEALAGKPVPKTRVTFRGKIVERQEELTTFREVFAEHRAKIEAYAKRGKTSRYDYRTETALYDPSEWYEINGYASGKVI
jgi:hypothetical protein